MNEELDQIEKNDAWELVPRPKNKNVIGTKWVFKKKLNEYGQVTRNKARLVCKGYAQIEGIDLEETFSPFPRMEGWNHEGGLHFRDNPLSKISTNLFSAELKLIFGRKTLFSAELFVGRKNKRQIKQSNNSALDLRVEIWSAGYFFPGNKFSAERLFGRTIFRPNYLSAELSFGRKYVYILATHGL
jgi:hypothetical protein